VVDGLASVIGPRRAEKIGRLLWERPMRRRAGATGGRTGARWLGSARLRRRRGRRRAGLDCRRGDRWWSSRGCPRDRGRNRGRAGRGWRRRGGDRAGGYDSTGRAEWFSGYDRDRRNYDSYCDNSEHGDNHRVQPARPRPALAWTLDNQIGHVVRHTFVLGERTRDWGALAVSSAYIVGEHQNFSTVTASSRPAGSVVRMGPTPRA
jgi:hypothetical protein